MADNPNGTLAPTPSPTPAPTPNPDPSVAIIDFGDGQKLTPETAAKRFKDTQAAYTKSQQEKSDLERKLAALEEANKTRGTVVEELSKRLQPEPAKTVDEVDKYLNDQAYLAEQLNGNAAAVVRNLTARIAQLQGSGSALEQRVSKLVEDKLNEITQKLEKRDQDTAKAEVQAEFNAAVKAHPILHKRPALAREVYRLMLSDKAEEILGGRVGNQVEASEIAKLIVDDHFKLAGDEVKEREVERNRRIAQGAEVGGPESTPTPEQKELGEKGQRILRPGASEKEVRDYYESLNKVDGARIRAMTP